MANYQLLDALISQDNARTYTFLKNFWNESTTV